MGLLIIVTSAVMNIHAQTFFFLECLFSVFLGILKEIGLGFFWKE